RRHTRFSRDWSSDVCSSDLLERVHRDSRDLRDPPPFVPGSPKDGPQQGKIPVDSRLGSLRALLLAEVVDDGPVDLGKPLAGQVRPKPRQNSLVAREAPLALGFL